MTANFIIGRLIDKFEKQLKMASRNSPQMNSLGIQQQAFGRVTILAIANVRIKLRQEKKRQDGIAPASTKAPAQAPLSAKEIIRTTYATNPCWRYVTKWEIR